VEKWFSFFRLKVVIPSAVKKIISNLRRRQTKAAQAGKHTPPGVNLFDGNVVSVIRLAAISRY
jgi:hypothetical protein